MNNIGAQRFADFPRRVMQGRDSTPARNEMTIRRVPPPMESNDPWSSFRAGTGGLPLLLREAFDSGRFFFGREGIFLQFLNILNQQPDVRFMNSHFAFKLLHSPSDPLMGQQ